MNLLSNAIKFTFDEGKIEIICSFLKTQDEEEDFEDQIEVKVSDNGIGIKEEAKK